MPGADRRPADVFIRGWAGGQDAALDVTVINPLQDLTREGAAAKPGHAADVAYQRKMTSAAEHRTLCSCPWLWRPLGDGMRWLRSR